MDENLCVLCEKMFPFHEAAKLVVAAFPKSLIICNSCAEMEEAERED